MDYQEIIVEREDEGIATITFNRPERRNAITESMGEEITRAVAALKEDRDLRVVILTGQGKGFCSGADLKTLGGWGPRALAAKNTCAASTGSS